MSFSSRPLITRTLALAAGTTLLLAGCSDSDEAPTVRDDAGSSEVSTGTRDEPGKIDGDPDPEDESGKQAVDVSTVEVSNQELGDFPYFDTSAPDDVTIAVDEEAGSLTAPIWDGRKLREITGRTYQWVVPTNTDSSLTDEDVRSRIDSAYKERGAELVTRSYLSDDALDTVNDTYLDSDVGPGLGDIMNQPVATYVIKQQDKTIWLQSVANTLQTSVVVVEEAVS